MAALTGLRHITSGAKWHRCNTQSRTGSGNQPVALWVGITRVQHDIFVRLQAIYAIGGRLKVINQLYVTYPSLMLQGVCIDLPRQVSQLHLSPRNRPWQPQTGYGKIR